MTVKKEALDKSIFYKEGQEVNIVEFGVMI